MKSSDWLEFQPQFPNIDQFQWEKLDDLSLRLKEWNTKVNLISRKDIDFLIPNHIIPCLALTKVKQFNSNERVIDVGTGGGLPGLPMAICNPSAQFTLLDSNLKKITIVEDIRKGLNLENVRVVRSRAEEFRETFDFILGRSVSAVPTFLGFASHFIDGKSKFSDSGLLYVKGGEFVDELKGAGIDNFKITPITELLELNTDKNVLHIPASDIVKFYRRKVLEDSLQKL